MSQKQNDKNYTYYKELLSALSDGEILDAELQDLLSAMATEELPELKNYWSQLQLKKTLLHGARSELSYLTVDSFKSVGLAQQIRLALEEDTDTAQILAFPKESSVRNTKTKSSKQTLETQKEKLSALSSFAIAASVMLMVTFGWLGSQAEIREATLAYVLPQQENKIDESTMINQLALNRNIQAQNKVLASSGNMSSEVSTSVNDLYLSESRIQDYMLLHAEHASLNTNQGMLPFARMSKVSSGKQF